MPDDDAAASLMSGQHEHFGYLDMLGGTGGIEGYVGDIVTRERFDALIDFHGTVIVAMESNAAEVCFNKSWLDIRHTHTRMGHVDTQSVATSWHNRHCH